jgi:hypothetical protein
VSRRAYSFGRRRDLLAGGGLRGNEPFCFAAPLNRWFVAEVSRSLAAIPQLMCLATRLASSRGICCAFLASTFLSALLL